MTGLHWIRSKRWTSLFLILTLLIFSPATLIFAEEAEGQEEQQDEAVQTESGVQTELQINASSAIIMEASTGQILFGMNEDEPRPPASMAKMMTEYIVMEAIKTGRINWDDMVTVSKYAANIPGSGQLIAEGDRVSVRNLFRMMSIYSGNDATVALAEHIAGTEENFVRMMNEKAKEMGLSEHAHFINATGLERDYLEQELGKLGLADQLPNIPGRTLLTAKDAATIARYVVLDHPEVLEIASQTRAPKFEEDTDPDPDDIMVNWNYMLEGWAEDSETLKQFAYPGTDGLKTGYTTPAGYCFTGTAVRDGFRLITVVMNTESNTQRFIESAKLMDYGFNMFEKRTVLAAKSSLKEAPTAPVKRGVELEVPVVVDKGVEFVVRKTDTDEQIQMDIEWLDEEEIVAPISQGDVVGKVTVSYESPTGTISKVVNLVAAEDVEKASWIRLLFRAIRNFFGDLFDGIINLF